MFAQKLNADEIIFPENKVSYTIIMAETESDGKVYKSYGLRCVHNDSKIRRSIWEQSDISDDENDILRLIERLNESETDISQLDYIVEDYIQELAML